MSRIGGALFSLLVTLILFGGGAVFLIWAPASPLPTAWNPVQPLDVQEPVTLATGWKLNEALSDDALCLAALQTGAQFQLLDDLNDGAQCGITPRVRLQQAGGLRIAPVETRCQTALRLAMWAKHGIQPAAEANFGTRVAELTHLSSYSCRRIRLSSGVAERMSTHATADAIDITGVVLDDGRRYTLLADWNTLGPASDFLRDMRNTACDWFRVTLGPDYNQLHADHFHLQHTGWGLCQ